MSKPSKQENLHRADVRQQLPRFISVRTLASHIERNEFTVYHWLTEAPERLPRITRVLGRVLFLETDVQEWFDAQRRGIDAQAAAVVCSSEREQQTKLKPRRGAPTKAERVARRGAAAQQGGAA